MEIEKIFSADQIKIHPELAQILREYTKAVIRANPDDILEFSWSYFRSKIEENDAKKLGEWRAEAESELPAGDSGFET
jgi:hypothetical protein